MTNWTVQPNYTHRSVLAPLVPESDGETRRIGGERREQGGAEEKEGVIVMEEQEGAVEMEGEKGVVVMKRYVDLLGQEAWLSMLEESAGIQRTYYWCIEKMTQMHLETNLVEKLETLKI